MSSEKEKFSERLNEALDDMNYPAMGHGRQSALARELDLSPQVIGSWLKGDDFPKTSQLVKISQFLDVRSNWLLSGVGSKYPRKTDMSDFTRSRDEAIKSGPRLDKEAFAMALAWMKLPKQQRIVLRKVIEELSADNQPKAFAKTSEHEEII